MVRWLISFVVVAITVIVQITIVDRIAFPGGTGPDLVLLVVAALALAGGPLAGALIGFSAGLALDIAPPGSHLVGQDALVFCLVGYVCGLVAEVPAGDGAQEQGHTALFEIVVTAAGAVLGEALGALLGVMLSDPRVTWPAVKHVLPVAVIYDVLLAPFVLFAVAAALRLARSQSDRAAWFGAPARTAAPTAAQGSIRQVNGGSTPRLRLSERTKGAGWVGGARGALAQSAGGRYAAKREPRLNLARSGSPSRGRALAGGALGAAFATGGLGGGAAKVKFGSRRSQGVLGGSWIGAMTTSGLAGPGLTSSRFGRSRMGRSLFGGSVFSRSPSALSRPAAPRSRQATLGRSSFLGRSSLFGGPFGVRRKASLMRSAPLSPAGGHTPRFARGGMFARLTAALRSSTRRRPVSRQPKMRHTTRRQPTLGAVKSPGRGWLRGTSSRRRGLGRGRRGSASGLSTGGLNGPARLHMPRPRVRRRRRTGGYR